MQWHIQNCGDTRALKLVKFVDFVLFLVPSSLIPCLCLAIEKFYQGTDKFYHGRPWCSYATDNNKHIITPTWKSTLLSFQSFIELEQWIFYIKILNGRHDNVHDIIWTVLFAVYPRSLALLQWGQGGPWPPHFCPVLV